MLFIDAKQRGTGIGTSLPSHAINDHASGTSTWMNRTGKPWVPILVEGFTVSVAAKPTMLGDHTRCCTCN